jgi:hypothetical protein
MLVSGVPVLFFHENGVRNVPRMDEAATTAVRWFAAVFAKNPG